MSQLSLFSTLFASNIRIRLFISALNLKIHHHLESAFQIALLLNKPADLSANPIVKQKNICYPK